MTKLVLKVKGMHCASCSILIDKLLGQQPGVTSIKTNYGAEKTAVEFDESKISLEKMDELVHKMGYDIIRPDEQSATVEEEEAKEARNIDECRRRVIASFALSAPIILYYMLIHMFNVTHVHEFFDFLNQAFPKLMGGGFFGYGAYFTSMFFWIVAQPLACITSLFVDIANPPFRIDLN